jgi:hypothetical protein
MSAGAARARTCDDARRMHVSFTRVMTSDEPLENAVIVAQEMERWLREVDGFRGFMVLSREGMSVGLTFWESREIADRHRTMRMEFLERVMTVAGVRVEEVVDFEIAFAQLEALAIDSSR